MGLAGRQKSPWSLRSDYLLPRQSGALAGCVPLHHLAVAVDGEALFAARQRDAAIIAARFLSGHLRSAKRLLE